MYKMLIPHAISFWACLLYLIASFLWECLTVPIVTVYLKTNLEELTHVWCDMLWSGLCIMSAVHNYNYCCSYTRRYTIIIFSNISAQIIHKHKYLLSRGNHVTRVIIKIRLFCMLINSRFYINHVNIPLFLHTPLFVQRIVGFYDGIK